MLDAKDLDVLRGFRYSPSRSSAGAPSPTALIKRDHRNRARSRVAPLGQARSGHTLPSVILGLTCLRVGGAPEDHRAARAA